VISEFMASNDATLRDDDGEYPDWIEINNAGGVRVGLHETLEHNEMGVAILGRSPTVYC
jgi:hypothetical protein